MPSGGGGRTNIITNITAFSVEKVLWGISVTNPHFIASDKNYTCAYWFTV